MPAFLLGEAFGLGPRGKFPHFQMRNRDIVRKLHAGQHFSPNGIELVRCIQALGPGVATMRMIAETAYPGNGTTLGSNDFDATSIIDTTSYERYAFPFGVRCNLFGPLAGSIVEVKRMALSDPDTEELRARAGDGDRRAREQLLSHHRERLRRMIAFRLDRRLTARVDPSDVVQEALTQAAQRLSNYLRDRPVPFYPWLRQIAWDRLIDLNRRHIHAQKRSVTREEPADMLLPDESALELANRLLARGSSPINHLLRAEQRNRVQASLAQLGQRDREVLVLRHLEQLSTAEMSAVLGISEGAVKVRHLRALERFRDLLTQTSEDES